MANDDNDDNDENGDERTLPQLTILTSANARAGSAGRITISPYHHISHRTAFH